MLMFIWKIFLKNTTILFWTFQKRRKNQNVFIFTKFFSESCSFTQKHYHKVILDLWEVKCPSNKSQIILLTKPPTSSYVTDSCSSTNWTQKALNKGLESDPSKSPPAQQHFATVLDFHWIQKHFLL